jgi:hypothetical protein
MKWRFHTNSPKHSGRADEKMLMTEAWERGLMTITCASVNYHYASNAADHFDRAQAIGLDCPSDVLEQLFYDHHDDEDFAGIVRFIDWATNVWSDLPDWGTCWDCSIARKSREAARHRVWLGRGEGVGLIFRLS